MSIRVDARGLSCPQPVILTRQAINRGQYPIVVQVDTVTSRENVRRMAEKQGCTVTYRESGDGFELTLNKA
jgi:TusA-related sulfurtransferase